MLAQGVECATCGRQLAQVMGERSHQGVRDHMPGLVVGEQAHHLVSHVQGMIEQGGLRQQPVGVRLPGGLDITAHIHHRGTVALPVEQLHQLPADRSLLGTGAEEGPVVEQAEKGRGPRMVHGEGFHCNTGQPFVPPQVDQVGNVHGPVHRGPGPAGGQLAQGDLPGVRRPALPGTEQHCPGQAGEHHGQAEEQVRPAEYLPDRSKHAVTDRPG